MASEIAVPADHEGLVWFYARGMVEQLGLAPPLGRAIQQAVRLHDIGLNFVPPHVLSKPDRLTPREFLLVQRHATISETLSRKMIHHADEVAAIVRSHHERLDGTGYPDGRWGREIPLGARIIAVADGFDALTSTRPYRSARSWMEALDEMEEEAGAQHDPMLVAALSTWLEQFADSLLAREGL